MNEILNRIDSLRKKNNMSRIELLTKLGLGKSVWGAWMRGDNTSFMKYLPQIAEIFNVSLDWLVGAEQKEKPTAESGELYKLSKREKEMLLAFRAQSEEIQDAALRVAGVDPESIPSAPGK